MALDSFIPTLWSNALLVSLKKTLVFAQPFAVNRDYEGDIATVGDTVKINSIGPVTVQSYQKNTAIAAPQELTDAQSFLLIDQAKYFNFMVDDIDVAQQKPQVMGQAMVEAAYALANQTDQYVAAQMFAGMATSNLIGTVASPKTIAASTDAYNFLVDLTVALDQANVPEPGRWVIVPPWFEGLLLKDDRFVRAPISSPNTNVIINGEVRFAAGLSILKSNNVPNDGAGSGLGGIGTGATYKVMCGTSMATSFAEQVNKVEAFRPPDRFADAVKGLHLYGAKVIRPEALTCLVVTRN